MILLDEEERSHIRQMWLKKVKGRKEKAKLDDLIKMSNKAQLKKVIDDALGMKWGREGNNLEVDLIKLGLFLVALLKEVED